MCCQYQKQPFHIKIIFLDILNFLFFLITTQEGVGKKRRGQKPQKGWRSDRMSGWLTKSGSCSQEAWKAGQKQKAKKMCSCSQSAGMRRNCLLHWIPGLKGWEKKGAMETGEATHEKAASPLLMNCTGRWLFNSAKRHWKQLLCFLLCICFPHCDSSLGT